MTPTQPIPLTSPAVAGHVPARRRHRERPQEPASAQHATKVLLGMAQILDVLNPIRKHHSAAHPRTDLLDDAEAELVCDTVRVLLRYSERRVSTFQAS